MNVNGLSTLPYIQQLIGGSVTGSAARGSSGLGASALNLSQDGGPQLSPVANALSTLQQVLEKNPTQYQQVTSQIATNLQNAAQAATAKGSTTLATHLQQLSSDFTSASQNQTLPSIQALAQAVGGGYGYANPGSSVAVSNSGSANSSQTGLSQLLSNFLGNAAGSTANSSLDALSIITNTLNSAGF